MIRVAAGKGGGWRHIALVCGKCSRKLDGGFGPAGDERLARLLRKRAGKGKRAVAGVVETKCLKLCPKNAVAVIDGARPGAWLVVPAGEPIDAVVARLGWEAGMIGDPPLQGEVAGIAGRRGVSVRTSGAPV